MLLSWFWNGIRKPGVRKQRTRYGNLRPRLEVLEVRNLPSFFAPINYATGTSPGIQAVGDFNGDGHVDLVVLNQGANTMSVLLGNGDGTFQPKTDYATGTTPWGVAVGDFNGDGKTDVAVVNKGANSVSVLLGNGDGTFQPKTDIALTVTPVALTVGDFNGDGKADLAVATENVTNDSMTMLLGNGNGTFQLPVTTVTDSALAGTAGLFGGGQSSISSADFNGDGHLDLVVVNNKDSRVPLGRFGNGPFTVQTQAGTVSVLLGNGDGTFQAPRNFAASLSPTSVAVGDFNNDGRPDFAVGGDSSVLSVFMNAGGGNFSASSFILGNGAAGILGAGDFNGDGATDLAVPVTILAPTGGFFSGVKVLNGQTGGGLQNGTAYVLSIGFPVAADFNGDGHLDLVGTTGNAIEPWLNNGNGAFPVPFLIPAAGVTLSSQATADFNGDGIPDLVSASSGQVQLGLGDGRFGDPTALSMPNGSTVAAVDADGNGTADVLVGNSVYPTGQVAAWLNSPGYDNRTGGAVRFTVTAPQQIVAGANASVTVTAVDALGNPVPGFLGTVDLDDTPAGSTALNLAGQYTFTAADNGRHTFLFSNLTPAGANTLSTFAVGMPTVSVPITVIPAATAKFVVAALASITAGTPFSFTVTAEDKFGNVETGYTGTVHFTASTADTQAMLPADYTFTAADAGMHTFSATLFRTQSLISPTAPSITATDAAHVSGTVSLNVLSLAPTSLTLFGVPNGTTAGSPMSVIVAALDIYGNAATGYAGTVHFSSSDAQAGLPADYTFTPADHGAHSFSVTLKTAGTQSLAVTDTGNPAFASSQSSIVFPSTPTIWIVNGLSTTSTAGVAQTFTLTAMDLFGNVATNYTGLVHFTSSDSQAVLPPDTFFTAADAGRHTFTATLKTAGTQTLSFTDTFLTFLTATESIAVTPAAAASVQIAGFPATIAGVAQTFTVTLKDAFGNVSSGYTGTVTFSSSDPIAALPSNYTFTAADAGMHTFTAALKRAGTQSITVTDTAVPTLTSTESGILVSPAAVSQFLISAPATVTQGVGFTITVSAVDAFGNVNAGYRGKVHLSTTDPNAGTQDFTFSNNDNGVHVFSVTLNILGFQTITVTDTTTSSIFGSVIVDVLAKPGGGGGSGGGKGGA